MNSRRLGLLLGVVPYSILVLGLAYYEAVDHYAYHYRTFGHADYFGDAFGPGFIVLLMGFVVGALVSISVSAFLKAWHG